MQARCRTGAGMRGITIPRSGAWRFGGAAVVRKERLELSRLSALEPKSSASTNSATFAAACRKPVEFKLPGGGL